MFRMATPHFGLYLFLFFYLLAGAWTFARLEDAADKEILKNKLNRLKIEQVIQMKSSLQYQISVCSNSWITWTGVFIWTPLSKEIIQFPLWVSSHLLPIPSFFRLSSLMEGRPFLLDEYLKAEDVIPPRWTKTSSILYALSILVILHSSLSMAYLLFRQRQATPIVFLLLLSASA